MQDTKIKAHEINLEFRNEYGQLILVIDCPVAQTTVIARNSPTCPCGHLI
jgi:hypothetical protein